MNLRNWVQSIIGTGTSKVRDPEKAKRIRLTNLMTITVFTTGTPFAFIFYFYGSKVSGIALFFYILSFLIILRLNQKQLFLFAKVLMLFLMNTAVIHYSIWYGRGSGLHLMLIPFACIPFLVFDKKKWVFLTAFTSISMLGYLLIDFMDISPILALDELSESVIYYGITFIAWTWIILEMYYLANQNHLAITNLSKQRKEQTASIVSAQEQERNRIARDLHDSLGQLLSALKVKLERSNKDARMIPESIMLVDRSVAEMRSLAFNLMPTTLENNGLILALDELVDSIRDSEAFKVFYHVHEVNQSRISKEHQYNIYRIVQEAFNNIIKHSKANEVNLQLVNVDDTLTITIEDNGRGFDARARARSGRGIQNIAARTEWLDGKFTIDSGPEIGTTLIVVIPMAHLGGE